MPHIWSRFRALRFNTLMALRPALLLKWIRCYSIRVSGSAPAHSRVLCTVELLESMSCMKKHSSNGDWKLALVFSSPTSMPQYMLGQVCRRSLCNNVLAITGLETKRRFQGRSVSLHTNDGAFGQLETKIEQSSGIQGKAPGGGCTASIGSVMVVCSGERIRTISSDVLNVLYAEICSTVLCT